MWSAHSEPEPGMLLDVESAHCDLINGRGCSIVGMWLGFVARHVQKISKQLAMM